MTADRLYQLIQQKGFGRGVVTFAPLISFPEYALPTRRWVLDVFGLALRFNFEKLGLLQYIDQKNMCVAFVYGATFFAWTSNTDTPGQPLPLLFGWIGYLKEQGADIPAGHRINFTVVEENGVEEVMFFEPQNQTEVTLTQDEVESIHCLCA